ncbi:MAG: type 1 glutamine amidotransferase [Planctomycetes bacterium]|nr:type 1 glutamine amidotransferase [Planctomycetota bacterium]
MPSLRFLLLQIRDRDDPIRQQEIGCFANALGCDQGAISTFDLLTGGLSEKDLQQVDAVLIGGSGNYSAAGNSPWLDRTLAGLQTIYELRKPTFASCWGFQAFARALGGRCLHDPTHAELGTTQLQLTEAGCRDPLFGELESPFYGQSGHEDHVVELPPGATLLASSSLVANQAFRLDGALIYCTQFHPELDLDSFIDRVRAYPQYVESIVGKTVEEFAAACHDTPQTRQLLPRFARMVAELNPPSASS